MYKDSKTFSCSFALVHRTFDFFLAGLGRKSEWLIIQFKTVQQSRQQTLRAHCRNIYIYICILLGGVN